MIETAIARCKSGNFRYPPNDKYVGLSLELYGEYSEAEAGLMEQLLKPGQTVVEVGANIGALTVNMAKHVGERGCVIAIEPQREIFRILRENLHANACTNAQARHAAAGAAPGKIYVPRVNYGQPGNFGAVSMATAGGDKVQMITIDSLQLAALHLLKIDVEGMEVDVIAGAKESIAKHRPILYVENDRPEKSAALIEAIAALDYQMWWHLPPLFNPDNVRGNRNNIYPGMVSINMVCVAREKQARIALREVVSPADKWMDALSPIGRRDRDPAPGEKTAAVIRPGAYGDVIMASSVIAHLKEQGHHVTVYTEARGEEVLRHDPNVDAIVMYHDMPGKVAAGFVEQVSGKFDRVVNLCESIEKNMIASENDVRYYWPQNLRRQVFGGDYLKRLHDLAEVPALFPEHFRQKFYPSKAEASAAHAEREKFVGRVVLIAASGSSPSKYWPHVGQFADDLADAGVDVVIVGELDELKGRPAKDGVHLIGTDWPLRAVLSFAQLCDVVVGQETGVLNAVAMEPMLKVVLLSHSAPLSLTRHWVNAKEVAGAGVACWPCHRIHHHMGHCTVDKPTGRAACQAAILPRAVTRIVGSYLSLATPAALV